MKINWLLSVLMLLLAGTNRIAYASCEQQNAHMIFYQPLLSHQKLTSEQLSYIQSRLKKHNIDTVILQWSRYGPHHLWGSTGARWLKNGLPGRVIRRHLIFGLYADPEFFGQLHLSDEQLEPYLNRLMLDNLSEASKVYSQFGNQIKGWYLPAEIDDLNWQTPHRQQILAAHLQANVQALNRLTPGKPVYISTFFGGFMKPKVYADFLLKIQQASNVIWLIQDGSGVIRSNPPDIAAYLKAIAATLPPKKWHGVVEAFQETKQDTNSSFCPISEQNLRERQALWCDATGNVASTIFSLNQLAPILIRDSQPLCDPN
ncbi:DUF4434 domain-containing protein [Chitinibacter fontanus]|uniref:DUF4434 domain-containing protein n=1 Tax=Chitinibacter fontanus TaxID=1737446 RepID=A0A7D5ZEQ5_9NEIS|nr:DUF4434 domain-containing protein [Chitinibacter fontanus]QLI82605.1 DUF4434 domain-containing protein [Chitinibacter fontanus]